MRTKKAHIIAAGEDTVVALNVTLQTAAVLDKYELAREMRKLNNRLFRALNEYGFAFQEIRLK